MYSEEKRYSRHFALPWFDHSSQEKIAGARILVVGCGGLGHPVLQYLTSSGVGKIGLADPDTIEISNLHRQVLFDESSIGKSKVVTAIEKLQRMNSGTQFIAHPYRITTENVMAILEEYDVVADCSDNFSTRYLLDDACAIMGKPLCSGAILRFEGHVSFFHGKNEISYRDIFPVPHFSTSIPNCEEGGVMGTTAGVIGCIQANEIIKFISGIGECLDGKLLVLDLISMKSDIISLVKTATKPKQLLKNYDFFCGTNNGPTTINSMKEITVSELKKMMESNDDFQLIDVREPHEFEEVNLSGILIPMQSIPDHVDEIDRTKKVVVHCKAGSRSANVIAYLEQNHGFDNLYNLKGGILDWLRLNSL